jgi:hypothetical protein
MKNVVRLENYDSPSDLETAIAAFVGHYNHARYHEALDNLTPADVDFGRAKEVMDRREEIKRRTLERRRRDHARQEGVYTPGQMGAEKTLVVEPGFYPRCSEDIQSI